MYGAPGIESFRRAIVTVRNYHLVALIAPMIVFRQEVVSNDEIRDRGGLDNTTRDHFLRHLVNCDRIRRRLTYNPDGIDLKAIVAAGIDASQEIGEADNPLGGDEVQGQSGADFDLPWHFDGTDPNFPPQSKIQLVGAVGPLVLSALDQTIVGATRLESRHRTQFITPMDSMRVYQGFQQMHQALTVLGGDDNRVDVTNPLPSEEPLGPDSSANRIPAS